MIGTIIGDMAGSFREFARDKKEELGLIPELGVIYQNFGVDTYGITDDSILSLATASMLNVNGAHCSFADFDEAYFKFGNTYSGPIGGYGGGFRNWLSSGEYRSPYNSCGNGSAMRISPVGYFAHYAKLNQNELLNLAFHSAIPTHNHPDGIRGAQSTAMFIYLALRGHDKYEIVDMLDSMFLNYERVEVIGHFDSICQETMPLVFNVIMENDNFYDAVLHAVTIPHGDSDTLGAIVGSIAEALYGVPANLKDLALKELMRYPDLYSVYSRFEQNCPDIIE